MTNTINSLRNMVLSFYTVAAKYTDTDNAAQDNFYYALREEAVS